MLIKIDRATLFRPLDHIDKVASSKGTIPILECAHITIDDNGMRMVGGNLEMFVQANIPTSEYFAEGTACFAVNAKRFHDIVKSLFDGEVEIEVSNKSIRIRADKTKFELMCQDYEMYPSLPDSAGAIRANMETESLRQLVKLTSFAASNDPTKEILNGVSLSVRNGTIQSAAAEGARLALVKDVIESEDASTVVSAKNLNKVMQLISGEKSSLFFHRNWLVISSDSVAAYLRVIEGTYPSFDRYLNFEERTTVYVKVAPMLKLLQRALITNDKSNTIKMSFSAMGIKVSSKNEEGNFEDSMPVSTIKGAFLSIHFNAKKLLEIVEAIENDEMRIRIIDARNFVAISGDDEVNSVYLIGPYRAREDE